MILKPYKNINNTYTTINTYKYKLFLKKDMISNFLLKFKI